MGVRTRRTGERADLLDVSGLVRGPAKINRVFFRWMEENDKVTFSHHTIGGFEAGDDYSQLFADPKLWYPILVRYSDFRLVLAHSGKDGWFSKDPDWLGSFGFNGYRLCVPFENVYCDFGYFDGVRKRGERERIAQRLSKLLA